MKKTAIILWIVAVLFLICSIPLFTQGNAGAGVCGIVIAAALGFVGYKKYRKDKKAEAAAKAKEAAAPAPSVHNSLAETAAPARSTVSAPAAAPRAVTLQEVKGYKLKYSYPDVDIFGSENCDLSGLELGYMIDFVPEPDNSHDPNAVLIMFCGVKRGYLHANRLQSMYHDFRARGGDAIGKVSSINSGRLQLLIGFYEKVDSEYEELVKSGAKFVTFKLSGNTNEEMQDTLRLCSIGDEVEPSYEPEKDKWIAECDYGEIGVFPSSAETVLEASGRAFVSSVQEGDKSGKYTVSVSILAEA